MTSEVLPKIPFNALVRAAAAHGNELSRIASEVIGSGWYVHGPFHKRFEEAFGEFLKAAHIVGLASGTDALELAVQVSGDSSRPRVLMAANAGGYAAVAARKAGYVPKYADIGARDHLLSPDTVAQALTDDVSVVVVTHLYGQVADIPGIKDVCKNRGITVIEDCAQAAGARLGETFVGSLADIATFSFYPTKNLGALGDGGAVSTQSERLAARVRQLSQYGWRSKYDIEVVNGRNSRLDELQAAFLLARLPLLLGQNEIRKTILSRYSESISSARARFVSNNGEGHVGHLAVLEVPDREAFTAHLDRRGIGWDIHYPVPDHKQRAYRDHFDDVVLPVTERAASQIVSLPLFPELEESEIDRICVALRDFDFDGK